MPSFAGAYVHQGMVGLGGEKMSKSKGNLVLVSTLRREGVDPMAIRLALLAHHHAADWMWHDDDLVAAEQRLSTWRKALSGNGGPSPTRPSTTSGQRWPTTSTALGRSRPSTDGAPVADARR